MSFTFPNLLILRPFLDQSDVRNETIWLPRRSEGGEGMKKSSFFQTSRPSPLRGTP